MEGGIDFLPLGLVGREHVFAKSRCLGVESYGDMSGILLAYNLQEHRHKTARAGRILSRRCDEVIAYGVPRTEDDGVAVDQQKEVFVRASCGVSAHRLEYLANSCAGESEKLWGL